MSWETIVSAPARGAGRTIDAAFPSNLNQVLTNSALGGNFINRQALVTFNWGNNVSSGGTPQWVYHGGRMAYRWSGTGLQANYWKSTNDFGITFPMTTAGVAGNYFEDTRCWRIMLTLACDTGVVTTGDNGLVIGPCNDFNCVVAANDGICFRPTSDTTFGVFIRQGGAVTFNADVATLQDITLYNTLELRIIGATSTIDGVLKAYLNGTLVRSWGFGAGTILPNFANGASLGWNVGMGNRGSPAIYLPECGFRISAAPTEQALL